MSFITYKVGKEGQDVKIRDYMKENLNLSGRFIRSSAMDRRLRVNGKEVKLNYKLQEDDVIEVTVNAEESQNIHHFRSNNDNSIVRLVSRLDRDTSGLIMIAKNQFSHMNLAKSMEKNLIKKSYLAIIHGNLENQEGTIDLPIGRSTDETIKRAVLEDGQRSITHYKIKESYKEGTLVELVLETGRTHQIRVHLSYVGCPIYGEQLYSDFNDEELISRQALHAYALTLPHPRSGEILNFESTLPEDMTKLIHNLQSK